MINLNTINAFISNYKSRFKEIHDVEVYKWEAVQWFQDHWQEDAENFKEMLLVAIDKTGELMDAKQYFPKRMLTEYLNRDPGAVRSVFHNLYDETMPLSVRLASFLKDMKRLHQHNVPDRKNPYQDTRAAMVYLSLRYPDQYFLYKYEMFTDFAKLIAYPHHINFLQSVENVIKYQTLCELVRELVIADKELIVMHQDRLTRKHYPDTFFHILTQDIIYATTQYFGEVVESSQGFHVKLVDDQKLTPSVHEPSLKGRHVEYLQRAISQKTLGELGEQVVLDYEIAKLERVGIMKKRPKIASKAEGDGLGYDIDSFDEQGNPIFIEVKTTNSAAAPFYVTNAELKKSMLSEKCFYLYRLFDFEKRTRTCKMIIHKGSLESFCINPVAFIVPYELISQKKNAASATRIK